MRGRKKSELRRGDLENSLYRQIVAFILPHGADRFNIYDYVCRLICLLYLWVVVFFFLRGLMRSLVVALCIVYYIAKTFQNVSPGQNKPEALAVRIVLTVSVTKGLMAQYPKQFKNVIDACTTGEGNRKIL